MSEKIEFYRNQIASARTEIKNLRTQLAALKHEHLKEIKSIKSLLSDMRCAKCSETASKVSASNHNGSPVESHPPISFRPIGIIETTFLNRRAVPRQPTVLVNSKGTVIINAAVYNNPEHALSGLEEFSHMWIIFYFHDADISCVRAKVAPPRLCGERRGVFSTRSPHRPCGIGLSLVRILSVEGNKIHFLGVDMVNGTPVLDIKPYIPHYDYPLSSFSEMLNRPVAEGINDAAANIGTLQLNDDSNESSSCLCNSNSPSNRKPAYTQNRSAGTPISPLVESPKRPDIERGSPDGQERFTPPPVPNADIRVPDWISDPPSQTYEVKFTENALQRLHELIGERAEPFKKNIGCLLSEDPRSQYVRNKYPDHEYSCMLEDLSVTCIFDADTAVCTIIAVKNAEELQ